MAAGRLIFPGYMPAEDANGDRVAGAKAYFYQNLTTTLANTYTTSGLTVANTNPVVADSSGNWPEIWADTTLFFTVALTDGDGAPLTAPWDGVSASLDATLISANLSEAAQESAETAATAAVAAQDAAETAQAAAEAAETQAQVYADSMSGAPLQATSITSLLIGTGAKSLTLAELGKLFSVGQTVVIARTSAPSTQMTGIIQTFDPDTGAMTVTVANTAGAGTHTDWTISLSSSGGVQSVAGLAGAVTADDLNAALGLQAADVTDFTAAAAAIAIAYALVL